MTAPRSVVRAVPASLPLPRLHVVPDPATLRKTRLCRLFTAIAGLVTCFGLFGVVGVHVLLAQGQAEVQRLQTEVERAQERNERLRLKVAELEAPGRIVATAKERLGMVPAREVVPLEPASLDNPPATTIPAPRPSTTTSTSTSSTSTTKP